MRRRSLLATPLVLLDRAPPTLPVGVVASMTILADFARQVGGDLVVVTSLVGPDADPHTFEPRPSDLVRLQAAGVVVENGLGLEGWLSRLHASADFAGRRIVAAEGIPTRTFSQDGRTVIDPHLWQDPRRALRMVAAIADGLAAALPPAAADVLRARAAAYTAQVSAEDQAIAAAIAAIPKARREIVTTHDAFGYYGARYDVAFRAAQGVSTDAEPRPRDLARLVAQIRRDHIRTVFLENMTDPRVTAALAREAGAVVGGKLYSDSLSAPDGPAATYLDLLRYNTRLLTAAMNQA